MDRPALPLLGLLGFATVPGLAAGDEAAAWTALRQGGHVALMRHTDAPGAADPEGMRLDDCATQRNLSARGRTDAKTAGERFRANGVAFARVLSSPWCRCVDTARLMDVGSVEIAPAFSNMVILRDQTATLTEAGRKVLSDWRGPGTLLVVTHGANIGALTGIHPSSGEAVVVAATPGGAIREVGRIPVPSD